MVVVVVMMVMMVVAAAAVMVTMVSMLWLSRSLDQVLHPKGDRLAMILSDAVESGWDFTTTDWNRLVRLRMFRWLVPTVWVVRERSRSSPDTSPA